MTKTRRPRRIKAWQVAGTLLMLAVGGFVAYGLWPTITDSDAEEERDIGEDLEPAKAAVEAFVLHPVEFPLRADATGHLAPWRLAELTAQASGIIVSRPVEEGQRVQKGDLLLQIDKREQQIRLEEAKAALLIARADHAVKSIDSGNLPPPDTTALSAARARLMRAESDFEGGTITQAELQHARREFESINVLSGSLRNEVQAVNSNLVQSEQQVARAQLELSRTQLIAPFSGRIADLVVEEGQQIGPGTKVMTLLEDYRMKVDVDVLEADLVHLGIGASATVVVPSFSDEVLLGRVYSINPMVDAGTGFGRVTVALSNPGGQLISGLYADVALETERLIDRLVVPSNALLVRDGRDLVFKILEGRGFWTYVDILVRSGNFAEIKGTGGASIIEPGDSILVAGHLNLAHDVPLEVTRVRELGLR